MEIVFSNVISLTCFFWGVGSFPFTAMRHMFYHCCVRVFVKSFYPPEGAVLGTIPRIAFFFFFVTHIAVMHVKPQYTSPNSTCKYTILGMKKSLYIP